MSMQNITPDTINSSDGHAKSHPFLTSELYIPKTIPKFKFSWGKDLNVFCIGSCFAREIETELQQKNCNVQSMTTLASFESNNVMAIMNEYNAGSISQRLKWSLDSIDLTDDSVCMKDEKYVDLLVSSEKSHDKEWVLERRKRIHQVYDQLRGTNLIIITLGLTEAWYDNQTGFYLNRIPPYKQDPDRYTLKILGVQDCVDLLKPELKKITDLNIPIILTVSPIPLQITFSGKDPIIANEESKNTLRLAVKELVESNDLIDYFPSYEAIRIHGVSNYYDGGIHVKFDIVEKIVSHMINLYQAT